MKKSIADKTVERLQQTPEGRVLIDLIAGYGTPANLASKLGVDPQSVRHWLYVGSIPRIPAIRAAAALGVEPSALRPDLPESAWIEKVVEQKPAKPVRQPVARSEDARLLLTLAEKYGSVKALCAAAFCTPGDFHTWKTRGRIPAIKLPTFLALQR